MVSTTTLLVKPPSIFRHFFLCFLESLLQKKTKEDNKNQKTKKIYIKKKYLECRFLILIYLLKISLSAAVGVLYPKKKNFFPFNSN